MTEGGKQDGSSPQGHLLLSLAAFFGCVVVDNYKGGGVAKDDMGLALD